MPGMTVAGDRKKEKDHEPLDLESSLSLVSRGSGPAPAAQFNKILS
jgi:hypothetical protein